MRLIINEQKIKRNRRIGNTLTLTSLAILGAGLVFAFKPTMILYSYICLVVGFVLTQFSMYYSSRFSRSPRYDEIISKAIETIRGDYDMYVHTTTVPILLRGPNNFWVLHPVNTPGTISYIDGKWKEKGRGIMMRLIGQESLGDPSKELAAQIQGVQDLLNEKGMPYTTQPEFKPLLVLLSEKTNLGDVENAPIPFVRLEELKRTIRRFDRENPNPELSETELEQLKEILG